MVVLLMILAGWLVLGTSGFFEIQSALHRIRLNQTMSYLWEEDIRRARSLAESDPDPKRKQELNKTVREMHHGLHKYEIDTKSMIVLLEEAGMGSLLYQGKDACLLIILSGPVAFFWYIRYKETCFRHGIRE